MSHEPAQVPRPGRSGNSHHEGLHVPHPQPEVHPNLILAVLSAAVTGFVETYWMATGFLVVSAAVGLLVPAVGSLRSAEQSTPAVATEGAPA